MSDLISRESLKQRINLNYNSHQYMDAQSIKDIINTEPSVEDKTVEKLKKIKAEIEKENEPYITMWETGFDDVSYGKYRAYRKAIGIIVKHIDELKGE